MKRFIVQVSLTAESAASTQADHARVINADDALGALEQMFKAYPEAICFDVYIGRGDNRHVGTFGTELPAQWGALAAGVVS